LTPLIALVALGAIPHGPASLIEFYSNSILLEFGMGVTLAWFVNSPAADRVPRFVGLAMILASPLAFALGNLLLGAPRVVAWGVPAALFVGGCVLNERARGTWRIPILQLLGDASYSIYLSHVIILSAAFQAVHRLASAHGAAGEVAASVLIVTVAIAGGVAIYWFVEKRLIELFKTPGVPPGHPVAETRRAMVAVSGKQPAE
jgi:peptidoglycan/LPS O-acetylase OafA/YrhL